MNPLELLERPLEAVLTFLHETIGFTYGWAIVMLTVMVRLVLLPLFIKQYHSARRMQEVAPQLKELKRKYGSNRQKLQEETMKFYKENDVNPFASCLPLVAQLPVFIALYYVLKDFDFADGSDPSFLWVIPDISQQLTEIGWGAVVLVIIYGLSQLLSTELSASPTMPAKQRKLMRFLPIVVVFFILQFPVPAGLVIYWMTTNLWTCGQQLVIKRRIGPPVTADEVAVEVEDAAPSKGRGKASAAAALVADAEPETEPEPEPAQAVVAPRAVPARRSRRAAVAEPAPVADEAAAPDLPDPDASAPEPTPDGAPEAAAADSAPAAEPAATGSGGRRRPRPKAAPPGGPSRPAQRRRPPKKRR